MLGDSTLTETVHDITMLLAGMGRADGDRTVFNEYMRTTVTHTHFGEDVVLSFPTSTENETFHVSLIGGNGHRNYTAMFPSQNIIIHDRFIGGGEC
jgi:hypothetical protein